MNNLAEYKKYEFRVSLKPSNIFFDTNHENLIVEYSECKDYFRILNTDTIVFSGWLRLNNNVGIRIGKKNTYWYNGNGRCIRFQIW